MVSPGQESQLPPIAKGPESRYWGAKVGFLILTDSTALIEARLTDFLPLCAK